MPDSTAEKGLGSTGLERLIGRIKAYVMPDNATIERKQDGTLGLKSGGIQSEFLSNGCVTTDKIASSAVTSDKLADGSVDIGAIADVPGLRAEMGLGNTLGALPVANGGTGATSAQGALTNLGVLDAVYPVGSIYMSMDPTDPSMLFGGTWTQIQDVFLLASGSEHIAGSTGGESSHALTTSEIPAHGHDLFGYNAGSYSSYTAKYAVFQCVHNGGSSYKKLLATESILDTGGGQPHNNMPPYIAVYVWERTA